MDTNPGLGALGQRRDETEGQRIFQAVKILCMIL